MEAGLVGRRGRQRLDSTVNAVVLQITNLTQSAIAYRSWHSDLHRPTPPRKQTEVKPTNIGRENVEHR